LIKSIRGNEKISSLIKSIGKANKIRKTKMMGNHSLDLHIEWQALQVDKIISLMAARNNNDLAGRNIVWEPKDAQVVAWEENSQ
jgi:hypothetical protein